MFCCERRIWYPDLFGGVTAFTREQMESVNGFSNEFYGWGGEDDDMLNRSDKHSKPLSAMNTQL